MDFASRVIQIFLYYYSLFNTLYKVFDIPAPPLPSSAAISTVSYNITPLIITVSYGTPPLTFLSSIFLRSSRFASSLSLSDRGARLTVIGALIGYFFINSHDSREEIGDL